MSGFQFRELDYSATGQRPRQNVSIPPNLSGLGPEFRPPLSEVVSQSGKRMWQADWADFRARHPSWGGNSTTDPIYRIPASAVSSLSRNGNRGPLLDDAAARAELEFAELCERHLFVGAWNDSGIRFDLLRDPPVTTREDVEREALNWQAVRHALRIAHDKRSREKGVIGWLLTEPTFLQEVDRLRSSWQNIQPRLRLPFPLQRTIGSLGASPETAKHCFSVALDEFLDRWGLTHLAAWDLPVPQGALVTNPVPPNAAASPRHGVHIFLPVHFCLLQRDDLWRQIGEFQRQIVQSLQINDSFAGLPHFESYARIFDVLHLERAIRSRFPGGIPRGGVTTLEAAIASGLRMSVEHVQKCRQAISKCLRGKKADVTFLRTAS